MISNDRQTGGGETDIRELIFMKRHKLLWTETKYTRHL